MKLTDQEQVVLKAIGHRVALVSHVIKAIGYPKATTKKILIGLSNKGVVSLHRHDWPSSLTPEQRKMMVKIGSNYYGAVSVRERQNPKQASKGKTALKKTGKALKGFAHGALSSAAQIFGAGAEALNPREAVVKTKEVASAKGKRFKYYLRAIDPKTGLYGQQEWSAESYPTRAEALSAGRIALKQWRRNPSKRIKIRNKYIDLVIKGQAKKTPQGWKVGSKTFAQGRGTVNVSSGYYLDRHTGMVYAKRERNMARRRNVEMGFYDASGFHPIRASSDYSEGQRPSRSRRAKTTKRKAKATVSHRRKVSSRKRTTKSLAGRSLRRTTSTGKRLKRHNISEGFYDASGVFHPIRSSADYSPTVAGETGRKAKHTRSRKRVAAKRKASSTARHRSVVKTRKGATRRLAGRAIKKSSGLLKKKRRNATRKKKSGLKTFEIFQFRPSIGDWVNAGFERALTATEAIEKAREGYRKFQGVELPAKYTLKAVAKNLTGARGKRNPLPKDLEAASWALEPGTQPGTVKIKAKVTGERRAEVAKRLKGKGYTHIGKGVWQSGKRNPSAESIRKSFAGSVNGERDLFFPVGTPTGKLAKLGKLVSITTEEGTIKPVSGSAWLCADTRQRLHVGSTTNAPLFDGPKRSFGRVSKIEYQDVKKHLGHNKQTIFFHHVGEENGIKPTLHADGKGGLVFKGGDYRITSRGLEN